MDEELMDEETGKVLTSWDGYKWYIENDSDKLPLNEGEETVLKFLYMVARRDRIFLDVGAHVGKYTVRMSAS